MTFTDFKKWLAFGTGIGIELGRENLTVAAVRVRPSGATVLGEMTVPRFREQPASEWGTAYAQFLKKLGAGHLAAHVLLPRDEVTVRQLSLPGVTNKDLAAAIRFEIDALNPYSEEEAVFDWARVAKSSSILVGITRRSVLDRYATLLAEAGVKTASFTISAAAIYAALRLLSTPPADGFVVLEDLAGELEVYGESPARQVFSARLEQASAPERALTLAIAELRLPQETEATTLRDALPKPVAAPADYDLSRATLAYTAALAGAGLAPRLAVNLLPPAERQYTSRLRFVPSAALAILALILAGAALAYPKYADHRYLDLLRARIRQVEPRARLAVSLDKEIAMTRNRAQTLDNFRLRTKQDLDQLAELTKTLAPPTWLNGLQLTRDTVAISGETEQAAQLLKLLDSSHQLRNSAFTIPIAKSAGGELFNIRSVRQGVAP